VSLLVYHRGAAEYARLLQERLPKVDLLATDAEDAFFAHIGDAEILLAWRFPIEALAKARRLRWLQLTSAGVEHLLPARDLLSRVLVTNASGIHAEPMADYTFGVMVMLHWGFPRLFRNQQARRWESQSTAPLAGGVLGVVGLGAIGGEIARRAPAFGLDVIGVKRHPTPVTGVRRVVGPDRLHEVLPGCDFVVLVVPQTAETRELIGERELRAMKPTSFLINLARGSVVDEAALLRALRERWIAGAALDVFTREPLPPEHPFWGMENVILTPHISGEPDEYARRVVDVFAENYRRWTAGDPLRNTVDLERGY